MNEMTINETNRRRSGYRQSLGDRIFDIFNYTLLMLLLMVVTLYPFLNTLAVSFNDATDSIRGGIYLWPRKWTLENYKFVFEEARPSSRPRGFPCCAP